MAQATWFRASAVCAALALVVGCVSPQLADVNEAKADYDNCVADHSAEHPDCAELLQTYKVMQERYEETARRIRACDPTVDECPRRR